MASTEKKSVSRKRLMWKTNKDFLSWVLHSLHALCVSPNKDSKTPSRKTEKKNPLT